VDSASTGLERGSMSVRGVAERSDGSCWETMCRAGSGVVGVCSGGCGGGTAADGKKDGGGAYSPVGARSVERGSSPDTRELWPAEAKAVLVEVRRVTSSQYANAKTEGLRS
jgi:hypothetical protein